MLFVRSGRISVDGLHKTTAVVKQKAGFGRFERGFYFCFGAVRADCKYKLVFSSGFEILIVLYTCF